MNQEKIGKFIKECRKKQKLTQEELASKLGVTDKAISKWENGRCLPDVSLFEKICRELDISVNELLSGESLNEKNYQAKTEEVAMSLADKIKQNKRKYIKIIIFITLLFFLITILINIASYLEFDVPYDSRMMKCQAENEKLTFEILGLSVINEHHIIVENDTEQLYFFTTQINLKNKRRSHFESWDSMVKLIDGKKESFGYQHILDIDKDKRVKVYHTDISLDKIKKANQKELEEIIKKSNLMCERKRLKIKI